ncbi:hypothetical protein GCM10009750_27220 [Agromyces salentinus]|uniref:Carboxypeptidase regulatory-like domain-containing protein n=1 Tax=Agromyces salentinus TaxID=269421 RepID=A0ABN2MWI7_9MICO
MVGAFAVLPLVAVLGIATSAAGAEPEPVPQAGRGLPSLEALESESAGSAQLTGTVSGVQPDPDIGWSASLVAAYRADAPTSPIAYDITSSAGDFAFDLPAGSYRLSAVTEARATEWSGGGTSFATAATIVVGAGETSVVDFDLDIPALSFSIDPADAPAVYGLGEPGTPLTVEPGTWTPTPDAFAFQWTRGSVPVQGATTDSYTLGSSGEDVLVAVFPKKAGYSEWPSLGGYLQTDPVEGIDELLAAMDPDDETHVSDRFGGFLPSSYVKAEAISVGTRPIRGFPTAGDSYAVLSTGVAAEAIEPGDAAIELSTDIDSAPFEFFDESDETRLRLTVAPPSDAACLALDVMFGTEDYPGALDYPFEPGDIDYFTVESPAFDDAEDGNPPDNHAASPAGRVIDARSPLGLSPEPGWRVNGWSPPLEVNVPLSGAGSVAGDGYTDVIVSVMDISDDFFDSVVIVDNLRFLPAAECRTDGVAVPIADEPPVVEGSVPVITGSARLGARLTVDAGEWAPDGVALSYRWERNGKAIPGATASTYRLGIRDLYSKISVRVTGTLGGADPVTLESAPTARVRLLR